MRIQLIGLGMIIEQVNRKEKSHAALMNRRILEQVNCEEKKTKLSVSRLQIKIEFMVRFNLNDTVFQLLGL